MEKYITCTPESDYPEIDFSKRTLLLTRGVSPNCIGYKGASLLKHSNTKYDLCIFVRGNCTRQEVWTVSILSWKVDDIAEINLMTEYGNLRPGDYFHFDIDGK
jgi:hypothetical protein